MAPGLRVTRGLRVTLGLRVAGKVVAAIVLTTAPIVATHRYLAATGPLVAVLVWAALLAVLLALAPAAGRRRRVVQWAIASLGAFGALVLIADMVIIPLSAYLLWFELVAQGSARGAVSFVYVMLVAYGSSLFAGGVTRRPVVAFGAYLAWVSFLAIPVLNRTAPVFVLLGASVVVLVAIAARGWSGAGARRAVAHAVVLLGLAVAAGAGLGRVTEPDGSRFVDNFLSPRFRDSVVTVFPNFPIVYDVPGYGYRFSTTDLSRTPVLSNRALFRVAPVEGGSIYLRTEVYQVFNGAGWEVSSSVLSEASESTTLTPEADRVTDAAPARQTEITILADFYSLLPHTLDTFAVAVSDRDEVLFEASSFDVGFQFEEPLLYGDRVTLYRDSPGGANVGPSAGGTVDELPEAYLSVPDDLPEEIRSIAAGLVGETDSQTIVNTLRYLRDGFEYTLEPPAPSDRRQFLSAFLEEHRRGFCVHYATAFTVLARLQGIPARYASGFLVRPPSRDPLDPTGSFEPPFATDVLVSGYSAHAWAEIYLPGTGWRIVEATPPMQPVGYEDTFFDRFASIRNEGRTFSQLEEILRQDVRDRDERRFALRLPSLPAWLLVIPTLAILAFAVSALTRLRPVERRFRRVVRRVRDRSVRGGFPSPEQNGWTRWAEGGGRYSDRVAAVTLGVFFGGRTPTERDVRFVRRWERARLRGRRRT